MPIDWGNRETIFRLLAAAFAVIGKEGFRGTYGDIARLFGEPATYDAIQSQFREVSKMADGLRLGKASIQNRKRPARSSRSAPRHTRPSSTLDSGDLEVIAQGRAGAVRNTASDLQHYGGAARDPASSGGAHPREEAKAVSSPPPSTSSSEACPNFHHQEETRIPLVLSAPSNGLQPPKPIPEAVIALDQVDGAHFRIVPSSSSAEEVATSSLESEMTMHVASAPLPEEMEDLASQASLDRIEERAQFRKLYSSDSHGTQAEHFDAVMNQSSQEHAAERARFRKLYFPENGKQTAAARQDASEAGSATLAQDQREHRCEEPMSDAPMANSSFPNKESGVSRFVGKNEAKYAAPNSAGCANHLIGPRENDWKSMSEWLPSSSCNASTTPATSYMHAGSRKCLLCNRRFPGKAFDKHEQGSERHREKLRDQDAISRANDKLERLQRDEIAKRKGEKPTPILACVLEPKKSLRLPSQSCDYRPQENGDAGSPDHLSRLLSLPPLRWGSSGARPKHSTLANGKQSMQELDGRTSNMVSEEQTMRETNGVRNRPLKRKRPASEPEVGESSTNLKAKHARQDTKDTTARDDMLVQISGAALDKLLELHPEIFDLKSDQCRSTPAPPGWQAMAPEMRAKSKGPIGRPKYHRHADVSENRQVEGSRAGFRNSSETSHEYFVCSSRCDDSGDSDYQYDADEVDLDEEEEEDDEEEEDE